MDNNNKTLRDEIAMSMSVDVVPTLKNDKAIELIAHKFGIEWNDNDPIIQIKFQLKYEAIIRYMYADAMLSVR